MTERESVFEGSCLCGKVRYRASGPFVDMLHCHCTDCQKCHGAAFLTGVGVKHDRLTIVQGEDSLRTHRAESGTRRSFCGECGTKITINNDSWDAVYIPSGTFDTPIRRKPDLHMFVRSKVPWFEIRDDLPQHPGNPDEE